ncbi:MAG TPA: hypothetical protein ENH12_06950 [Proteobacteria bacterium]|nr:hypothetical protein [Pseudomonadota bacterium]
MTKHPGKKHQYESAFEKMNMYAIKDRASLLRELDYSAAEVKKRIKEDVKWENEGFKLPAYYSHIDKIVDYVFA